MQSCLFQLAIPVVPTIRVIVTFTKFEGLEPLDEFQTPPSSPTSDDFEESTEDTVITQPSSSNSSWFRWKKSVRPETGSSVNDPYSSFDATGDPFDLSPDYKWITEEEFHRRRLERKAEMK